MTEQAIELTANECGISEDTYWHRCVLGGFSFLPLDCPDCPASCGVTLELAKQILASDQEGD